MKKASAKSQAAQMEAVIKMEARKGGFLIINEN